MVNEAIVTTVLDESSDEVVVVVSVVVVDSSFSAQDMMVRLNPETRKMYKSFFIFFPLEYVKEAGLKNNKFKLFNPIDIPTKTKY
jgi:hypothetical protein